MNIAYIHNTVKEEDIINREIEERELENPNHYKRPKEYQNAASLCYRE